MNKSLITNLIAVSITSYGMLAQNYSTEIFMAGLFALSGGLTNWLAIHMLFEKVPLLYGSGVIPLKFEEIKEGIKNLIMNEFFSKNSLENFLKNENSLTDNDLSEKLDYDLIFDKLVEAIEESSMGSMLNVLGGKKSLLPLKIPIEKKIKQVIDEISSNNLQKDNNFSDVIKGKIEMIIDKRLSELTPDHVKIIMRDMIHKHLGWLVVWGGFFGFVIGVILGVLGSLN